MRKLLKSKKALSPVVAAIILIAVTVAVSIAVAAWMGSISQGFMETKELTINSMNFPDRSTIELQVTNTGTGDMTISQVKVNGNTVPLTATQINAGDPASTLTIPFANNLGSKYSVQIYASDGTMVGSYTDTA